MNAGPTPADAAEILSDISAEQRRAQTALGPDPRVLYGAWGAAWLLGFLLAYLACIPADAPFLPLPVALAIAGAALVAAIAISAVHAIRRGHGTRGPSNIRGAIYGNAFPLAFIVMGLLGWRLIALGTPADAMLAYWTTATCLIIGGLGIAGAALWNDRGQLVFSAWVLLLGAIAAWIPAPRILLVGAAAGLGFLVLAAVAGARPELLHGPIAGSRG